MRGNRFTFEKVYTLWSRNAIDGEYENVDILNLLKNKFRYVDFAKSVSKRFSTVLERLDKSS